MSNLSIGCFAKGINLTDYTEPRRPVGTVAELFAGVGGFRIGLARAGWKTVFSNQWEPSTKAQPASEVYVFKFGPDGHTNQDIAKVIDDYEAGVIDIPETTLLVGGFPCQDYSVAKSLNSSKGLEGKKGVLWWEILRLVQLNQPPMILLENVDRLLKSPASRRGRDFAIMLASLSLEGYLVEWRVVNAAEYGFNQRRKRVFIVAKRLDVFPVSSKWTPEKCIFKEGVLAKALPVEKPSIVDGKSKSSSISLVDEFEISLDLSQLSSEFGEVKGSSRFRSAGVIMGNMVSTCDVSPSCIEVGTLGDVLVPEEEVDPSFLIPKGQIKSWKYLKGAKRETRVHAGSGKEYFYAEGSMAFPDLLENPSRTILTGEGGTSPSRFKHIIKLDSGRYRRLTPVELERLNGFPDNWTMESTKGIVSDTRRAFFMGNALVVGLVEKIGLQLASDWKKVKSRS